MELGRLLRLWLPPTLLGLAALFSWQAANRADFESVGGHPEPYSLTTQTPLFSARRLPNTLRAPISQAAISPAIQQAIDESSGLNNGSARACLVVMDGSRLLEPSATQAGAMVPASNQKLITTYAALGLLGTDFRFTTRVATNTPAANGTVESLYLIGGGDPFLYTSDWIDQYPEKEGRFHTRLEDLASQVADSGITEVGTLYGDESIYDQQRTVAAWDNRLIEQNQAGPLSALSVNEGFVDWPQTYQSSFRPRSQTDNPPLHAASVFADLLAERGVTVGTTATATAPGGSADVATIQSPRMVEIITHVNSFSSNFGAELLVKRIGYETRGIGSTADGTAAIMAFLVDQGISTEGLVLEDGSGLAESNRVTCLTLAQLLSQSGPDSDFTGSLSIAGQRGSLAGRLIETPANEMVYAKTGTLRGVRALSGFALSQNEPGSGLAFSYVVNDDVVDDNPLAIEDELVSQLVTYPAGPPISEIGPLPAAPAG